MTRARADALLVFAALIWGVAFYFQKSAMDHIGPALFLATRATVALLVLLPLALRERTPLGVRPGSVLPSAVFAGALFLVAALLQQWGMVTATVVNSGFLTSLYVVLTPFLVWVVRRERPTLRVWVAATTATAGVWALSGGGVAAIAFGDALIATSAVFWAAHVLATASAGAYGRPVLFTCAQFAVVSLGAWLVALAAEPIEWQRVLAAWDSILFVGVFSSALTFTLMSVALRYAKETDAVVLLSLETLFAAAAGYVLLGERLSTLGMIGAAMIFGAVVLVQVRRPHAEARAD